jgi:hypothetical protein
MPNFLIVLFKNKTKKKIINKFMTEKRANEFFNNLIVKSDNVVFERNYENGVRSDYELAILKKTTSKIEDFYIKDELGRQVKVDLDDDGYHIFKIKNYYIEESFHDYQTKKKINSEKFISKYLKKSGVKLVSKLNNKIIVQHDTNYYLFTFKTVEDSSRFIDNLSDKFISEGRIDCLFVKDSSSAQKKYLYELLESVGYPRQYLFRHSTTYPIKT